MLAGWLWVDALPCTIHHGTDKSNREEKEKLKTAKDQIKATMDLKPSSYYIWRCRL